MNNMKQWQQDISNVVDKNSLDIKNLQDNSEVGKLTVRIDNIEAKDREQDVQLSNHGEQLENLFNKINTDVADTKTEINNTIEQLRLNTNNSITALQTSTDRALDTIKQNTTDSLNSLKTSIDRNIELLKSNTADSITALQTSIDRHTEELDNFVRSLLSEDATTSSEAITIDDNSSNNISLTTASEITVANGTTGKAWSKSVKITNSSSTITLGSSWTWVNGEVPTVSANSLLVLKWCYDFGIAGLVSITG